MSAITLRKDDPIRILMVEDNLADAILVRKAFMNSKWPLQISLAMDGEEAVDRLKGKGLFRNPLRTDMIFLDLNLPKKNGFEVLSEIRSNPNFDEVPIIVLTNASEEEDRERVYESGADFYFVKPSDLEELHEIVRLVETQWFAVARYQV